MPDRQPSARREQAPSLRNKNQRELLDRKRPSIEQSDSAYKAEVLLPKLTIAVADRKPGDVVVALADAYVNYLNILSVNIYQEPRDYRDRDRTSLYNYLAEEKRQKLFTEGLPTAMTMFKRANPSYPIPKFLGNKDQLDMEIGLRMERLKDRQDFILRQKAFTFIESEISSAESKLHSYFNTFVTAVTENNPAEVKRVFNLLNIRGILSACEKNAWVLFESGADKRIEQGRLDSLRVKFITAFRMAALLYGYFSPIFESYENTLISPGLLREKASDLMIAIAKARRAIPEYAKLPVEEEGGETVNSMITELSKVKEEDCEAVAKTLHEIGIIGGLEDLSVAVSMMYRKLRSDEAFREYIHVPASILQKNSEEKTTVLGHELSDLNDAEKLPSQEIVKGLVEINDSNLLGIKARRAALEYITELIRESQSASVSANHNLTRAEIANLERLTDIQRATLITLQEAGILQKQMQDAVRSGQGKLNLKPLIIAKTLYSEAKVNQRVTEQGAATNAALGRLSSGTTDSK